MATYAEVLAAFEADSATGTPESPESPGLLRSFARGAIQSPAEVGSLAELGLGRPFKPFPSLPGEDPNLSQPEQLRQALIQRSGIPEPVTFGERVAERVGKNAPLIAAGNVGAVSAGGLSAFLLELGTDLLASSSGEAAAEAGANTATQLGVEVFVSLLSPSTAAGKASRRAASADPRLLAKIAKKHKIPMKKLRATTKELKRRLLVDPSGGDSFETAAKDRLTRTTLLDFPEGTVRPTTAQSLGETGGQNIAGMESALARSDVGFSSEIGGIKGTVKRNVLREAEDAFPKGSPEGAITAFGKTRQTAEDAARKAWRDVPLNELPDVKTSRLKVALRELRKNPSDRKWVPLEATVIDEYGDTINMAEIQSLRSDLLSTQRAGKSSLTEGASNRARRAGVLIDALNEEIERLPREGGDAYRAALKLTRENKQLFNAKSIAVKAFTENTEPSKIAARIKRAPDPTGEARRAIRFVEQQPGGVGDLRAMFVEELFGETLGDVTPRRVLSSIKAKRGVYKEIFGAEKLSQMERVVNKIKTASRFTAGTPAAVSVTGSNVGFLNKLFDGVELAARPAQAATTVLSRLRRTFKTAPEQMSLMRELLKKPGLALDLLEAPDVGRISAWINDWEKFITKASLRSSRAASRSVQAPLPIQNRNTQ